MVWIPVRDTSALQSVDGRVSSACGLHAVCFLITTQNPTPRPVQLREWTVIVALARRLNTHQVLWYPFDRILEWTEYIHAL